VEGLTLAARMDDYITLELEVSRYRGSGGIMSGCDEQEG
jgi:hypothetical protein